jgi:hypothetical protein
LLGGGGIVGSAPESEMLFAQAPPHVSPGLPLQPMVQVAGLNRPNRSPQKQ